MRKYNILATLLICSTLLFGCGQNNETSETSNGITKEQFLTARQSGLSQTYGDKNFELIKTVRDMGAAIEIGAIPKVKIITMISA